MPCISFKTWLEYEKHYPGPRYDSGPNGQIDKTMITWDGQERCTICGQVCTGNKAKDCQHVRMTDQELRATEKPYDPWEPKHFQPRKTTCGDG